MRFVAYLTLVAAVLALSAADKYFNDQAPPKPNDSQEISQLGALQQEFTQFCLIARDITYDYLSNHDQPDSTIHFVNILFQGGENIGLEPYVFHRELMDQMVGRMRDSNKQRAEVDLTSTLKNVDADEKYIYLALFGALDRTKNQASRDAINMLEKYREVFGPTLVHSKLTQACREINELELKLSDRLKNFIKDHEIGQEQTLDAIRCSTSRKVTHLNNLCQFALSAPSTQTEQTYVPLFPIH